MGKSAAWIVGVGAVAGLWYYVQIVLWRGVRIEARAVWIWGKLFRRAEEQRIRHMGVALVGEAERLAAEVTPGSGDGQHQRSLPRAAGHRRLDGRPDPPCADAREPNNLD